MHPDLQTVTSHSAHPSGNQMGCAKPCQNCNSKPPSNCGSIDDHKECNCNFSETAIQTSAKVLMVAALS